jgi:hypothetical protein
MKTWTGAIVLLMVLCLAVPAAFAEFYKYRDENGVLRFTDDLSMVPPDQRPKIDTYEEVKSSAPPPAAAAPAEAPAAAADEDRPKKALDATDVSGVAAEHKRLDQRRKQLEKERQNLGRQKQALQQERARIETEEDARAYDAKVQQLNERIAGYEKRRAEFTEQAEALNALREQ